MIKKNCQQPYWKCCCLPVSSWVSQHCLLSASMKDIYFYTILYPAALVNSLCLHSFSVESLVSSTYIILSPRNNNTFNSFLPMFTHLVSWSCLIVLTGTSGTMLNSSGHPCLACHFMDNFQCTTLN